MFPKCDKRARKKLAQAEKLACSGGVGDFDEKIGERNKKNPR